MKIYDDSGFEIYRDDLKIVFNETLDKWELIVISMDRIIYRARYITELINKYDQLK